MTNTTPHGQVPEALIDLIDAYAETRHRCGGIYNARTEAARKAVIEALSGVQALSAAPGVGNSGFDHKTAADFLSGKTISDEAVRKFVQASRWAHDEKASLSATLLAMHGVLTSREAEIALLKKALMEAEAAPQQEAQEPCGWDGAEEWEKLAWHLCAEENGEDACNELIWEGGPMPEPWGDRWLKYEGEARRMIDLVRTHVQVPQPAPVAQGDARAEQSLLKVLTAVQRYLPPDGPSAKDTLAEIIGIVDPWPLGDLKGKA